MKYSEKVFEKKFADNSPKEAYLNLCKWLATNVISQGDELKFFYEVVRIKGTQLPTFKLTLHVALEEEEIYIRHCKVCKEVHQIFYMNVDFECGSCKVDAYKARLKEQIGKSSTYFLGLLKQKLFKQKMKGDIDVNEDTIE